MPREQVADLRAKDRTAEELPAREVMREAVCQATEPGRAHRMAFSRCVLAAIITVDTEPSGSLMALRTGMKTVIFGMSLPISSRLSSQRPRR